MILFNGPLPQCCTHHRNNLSLSPHLHGTSEAAPPVFGKTIFSIGPLTWFLLPLVHLLSQLLVVSPSQMTDQSVDWCQGCDLTPLKKDLVKHCREEHELEPCDRCPFYIPLGSKTNHITYQHQCPLCTRFTGGSLRIHIMEIHLCDCAACLDWDGYKENPKKFWQHIRSDHQWWLCPCCQDLFNPAKQWHHLNDFHGISACLSCSTSRVPSLHLRTHMCPICDNGVNPSQLLDHLKREHRFLPCKSCKTDNHLRRHVMEEHQFINCVLCGESTTHDRQFHNHLQEDHHIAICKKCDPKSGDSFYDHIKEAHEVYTCDRCCWTMGETAFTLGPTLCTECRQWEDESAQRVDKPC